MKKNVIIGVVAVLFIVGIGFTFAYFISGVSLSGNGSDVNADTGELMEVEYDAGTEEVNVSGVVPGDIITKEFDIILRPTNIENEATYAIKLDISSNTFVKCDDSNYDSITNACTQDVEELVYRLKDSDNETIAEGTLMGLTGEQILAIETKTASDVTTYHYILEIEFVETNADQNHNMNKEFKGRVIVEFSGEYLREQILADNPTIDNSRNGAITGTLTENTTGTLFAVDEGEETSYVYAGAVDNNWVSFAGYYWRIIRINGDGSIRMIYSGEDTGSVTEANITGEGTLIGTSAYNTNSDDNAYIGYVYGTPGSSTYEETHANINDSTIKSVLDSWYETNIVNQNLTDYISTEAGFCNDRQTQTIVSGSYTYGTTGYGTNITGYAPWGRLYENSAYKTSQTPSLRCINTNDLFTVSGSSKGNHDLRYPIGLITSDEVVLTGGFGGTANQSWYLYTGEYYWTMSPYYVNVGANANMFFVTSNGDLGGNNVSFTRGVRPVINLHNDVMILSGDGTSNRPYRIEVR